MAYTAMKTVSQTSPISMMTEKRPRSCVFLIAPSEQPSRPVIPYDLGAAFAQIEKVGPPLVQDPIFRRLATAARRQLRGVPTPLMALQRRALWPSTTSITG